jgi:integrase
MASITKLRLADGRIRHQAIIRLAGQRKKRQFRTRGAAQRWATATEAKILDGVQLPQAPDERRTVAEALDAYAASGALDRLRSAKTRRQHLAWWTERIGAIRLHDLTRMRIRQELAALEAGKGPKGRPAAPATRRRYLSTLSAALAWCVDSELIDTNPASRAARKGKDAEPPGRVRYLTDAEREALLEACAASSDRLLLPLIKLALLTGMRQGELLGLRWSDVDLARGLASLRRAKAGARAVALAPPAAKLLRELQAGRVLGWERVFAAPPAGRATFSRYHFDQAVKTAGLEDFHFHDLRHCFASALLSAGATLPELAAALGHRTLAMVARYAHLEKAHAAELVARVAARFE